MKTLIIGFLTCCFSSAGATIHTIIVSNFQFTPSNLNVVIGDVVRWELDEGFHNSVSLSVPVSAVPWSSPDFVVAGDNFSYTVSTAGFYQYQCAYHAGFMTGSFTASGAVPVTLSAFNVNNQQNRPRISWTTQQESNSDYFAVRRSYDGHIFTEIGRLPAAGQSQVEKQYSFVDVSVRTNVKYVYYELVITDKDGSRQLSPIKLYKNNEQVKKLITSISPNPVQEAGHLMIQFNADVAGRMLAKITDVGGKTVLVKELYATTGVNSGHIHLGDLASGNYVVQFSLNGVTETYKVRKR